MDGRWPGEWERTPDLWEQAQIHWRPAAGTSLHEQPEWLVTNGLGGFACGTVLGAASRRYHGWLIAALAPPVDRRLLWAGAEEWLRTPAGQWPLANHDYGGLLHPDGWRRLVSWRLYPFPTWLWSVDGVLVERTLFMVRGQNATVARYRLLAGPSVELVLKPFINCRDYHHTVRATGWEFRQETLPYGTRVTAYPGAPPLVLAAGSPGSAGDSAPDGRARYDPGGLWYYNFHYAWEAERGLDHVEDHFCPGAFHIRLAGCGDSAVLVGYCPRPEPQEAPGDGAPAPPWHDGPAALFVWAEAAYGAAADRRRRLAAAAPGGDPDRQRLALAADDFVAWRRTTRAATLIAGYPWFTDWGRDAMISLPGLLLCTGRHQAAREVLLTFAAHRREGLVPNRFADHGEGGGEPAAYNAADASLWFVYAVWKYWCATGDTVTTRAELLPAAADILQHYLRGTAYGIHVGSDGLVYAGHPGVQLTWMDAKVGDWVVTPRMGAAVEINALWYNALRAVETLAGRCGRPDAGQWGRLAAAARRSFLRRFAHPDGWLRDVVQDTGSWAGAEPTAVAQAGSARAPAHEPLRPNQLLALALPFPVVGRRRGRAILERVARDLLTPVGLRTLAPGDPEYRGRYTGDQWQRDAAYHQGTVWPWLLGPFISGFLRCHGRTPETVAAARVRLEPLRHHLRCEGALGQVSEIFDGDPPHVPRGCFAQAWSVAEWLRVWAEELEVADDRPGVHADRGGDGRPRHRPG